jgi:uncharacterized membrane protein YdfJ with MMPL/SSD domain
MATVGFDPADDVVGEPVDLPEKFVVALRRPWMRLGVALVWFALAASGLSFALSFMAGLESDILPIPGTPSGDAQDVSDKYFPGEPLQGALLVKATDGSPLLGFVNRSTCTLTPQFLPDKHVVTVNMSCENASAVGGGCVISTDIAAFAKQAVGIIEQLVPQNASKMVRRLLEVEMAILLNSLPQITSCPVMSSSRHARDWLDFQSSLSRNLDSKLPGYKSTVISFASLPAESVERSYALPSWPIFGNMSRLKLSVKVPAGISWGLVKNQFLADQYRTSLIAVETSRLDGKSVLPMSSDAMHVSSVLHDMGTSAPPTLRVKDSSMASMFDSVQQGIDKTMGVSTETFPIALVILALMAQNVRLVLVTLFNLVACITSAVLIMYPISKQMTIATMAPAMMMAIALAMSIDYSLFILTRFQREVGNGCSAEAALIITLRTSGRIVVVSGMTLFLCFLAMLCFPVSFISSMGVGASVTVFTAVVAALTLSPVFLLQYPVFFTSSKRYGFSGEGCCCRRSTSARSNEDLGALGRSSKESVMTPLKTDHEVTRSCWTQFGVRVQKFARLVAVVLVAVAVPVALTSIPRLRKTVGLLPLMPTDALATHTLVELQSSFGAGSVFPTTLIVVPTEGSTATPHDLSDWQTKSCQALKEIADNVNSYAGPVPAFTATSFFGVMIMEGTCMPPGMGITLGSIGSWSHIGSDYSATQVQVSYNIDPFSTEGQAWLVRLRDAINTPIARAVGSWHLYGQAPLQMDVSNATFEMMPLLVSLVMGVVMVVMAVSFKSLIAPIRAVFCLLWMLVLSFGLAIFVFQDGLVSFLHWDSLGARPSGGMSWLSPCVAFPILVGLGLDYDIFYSERVVEEWEHGYNEKEAAVRALSATADIISAAGSIMLVAFLALLLSTTSAINEIAFLVSVGVIIDCFLTTKVVVPCAMALLGKRNFWPRRRTLAKPAEVISTQSAV